MRAYADMEEDNEMNFEMDEPIEPKKNSEHFKEIALLFLFAIALNFLVTGFVDWVINPELSQMEIFLRTPKHFLWCFK